MALVVLISCLIGIAVGGCLIYFIWLPKAKEVKQINQQVEQQNKAAKEELTAIEQKTKVLKESYSEKYKEYTSLQDQLEKDSKIAENRAKKYYDKMMDLYKSKLGYDLKEEQKKYDTASADYQKEYKEVLADLAENFQEYAKNLGAQFSEQEAILEDLKHQIASEQSLVNAAVAARKRAVEMESKEDFYKLNIPEADLEEVNDLRKCAKRLRNPEPLNKVIWKVYYEKPCNDLINRVIGSGVHTGIYKITNLGNGMCYVGQSVDLSSRFKQHIKRGLGADTPTRNKLYPAMMATGVENFSFEVIEECPKEELNDREDYWQDYFKAKEFGYSIK